ncbi:NAD(P)H-dependent oxidoreductase [Phenylobacterium sp. LjRoot225]|uniref:FMN-dependent NADH-azoreductase n=1 Tax=Phenylobacterium sp. LjRoot225 TaxID=3342285 RepID=UPI003ECDE0DF
MKLLHIDAGITGEGSVSRQVSAAVVQAARDAIPALEVVRRDLDADAIPHLGSQHLGTAEGAGVLQEFLDADVIVIGAPMYNFTIPSQLKAWFDRIVVAGKTFRYTEAGPEGLAGGKKIIVASARGNLYAPGTPLAVNDFHEPYLRAVFKFIGIDDVTILRAEGVAFGPEQREAAVQVALAAAPAVVAELRTALAA